MEHKQLQPILLLYSSIEWNHSDVLVHGGLDY